MNSLTKKALWSLIPTVLFLVLVPGVLLTIPNGQKSILTLGEANMAAVFVHAIVFFALVLVVKIVLGRMYQRKNNSSSSKSSSSK